MCLVHNKDQVDDDVQEGLAEDHQHDERRAQQAAEQLRAQGRAAQLRAQYERVPMDMTLVRGATKELYLRQQWGRTRCGDAYESMHSVFRAYQENLKRPTGGGQKGLELGSERPAPAAITTALSFGQICTLHILEIGKRHTSKGK
jgi:hypothetical protein